MVLHRLEILAQKMISFSALLFFFSDSVFVVVVVVVVVAAAVVAAADAVDQLVAILGSLCWYCSCGRGRSLVCRLLYCYCCLHRQLR